MAKKWFKTTLDATFQPWNLVSKGYKKVFSDLFGWNNNISNMGKKLTGSGLTDAEKEANEFNAREAEKNRQFQDQQRSTQIQTAVDDAKKAGVNPATLYGSSAVTAGTTGGSAASSATSGDSNPAALTSLLGTLGNIFANIFSTQQRTQVAERQLEIQSEYNKTMQRYYDIMGQNNTAMTNSQIAVNQSQINIAAAKIPNIQADTLLKMAQQKNVFSDIELKQAQKAYTQVQTALSRVDFSKRSRYLEASISLMAAQTAVQQHLQEYYQSSSALNWAKELDVYTMNDIHKIEKQATDSQTKMLTARAARYEELLDAEIKNMVAQGDLTEGQAKQLKSELVLKYITGIGNTLANVGRAAASFTPQGQFLDTIGNIFNSQPSPWTANNTWY